MRREIDGRHVAFLEHTLIVHDTMILPTVAACSVQEENLLRASTGLLIEALAPAPDGCGDICIAADDGVVVPLGFGVSGSLANELVVEEFEYAAPDVRPCRLIRESSGMCNTTTYH